jgi:hypothetical protein
VLAHRSVNLFGFSALTAPVVTRQDARMGYYTQFWGTLKFTRPLGKAELAEVDAIINAGWTTTPEVKAVIDRERKARRKAGRAEIIDVASEIMRGAELQGFIAPRGWPGHIDYQITADGRGLCYASEKSYTMVEGANFIIANGRQRIVGFGLKGSMFAETEFAPYHWLLMIGRDGWAVQKPCRMTRAIAYSPRRYAQHLRLNWRSPSLW